MEALIHETRLHTLGKRRSNKLYTGADTNKEAGLEQRQGTTAITKAHGHKHMGNMNKEQIKG